MQHPHSLGATEEWAARTGMLSHFRNATLGFRDAFVQSAQFICLCNHGSHNDREIPAVELIKLNRLAPDTKALQAATRMPRSAAAAAGC
jgi:hypothetical protein